MAKPTTDAATTEQITMTIMTIVLSLPVSGGAGVKIGVVVVALGVVVFEAGVVVFVEGVVFGVVVLGP